MSQRSACLVVVGAIGCSILLLCLFVAAFAGYTYLAPALAGGSVDRIAYVDSSDNVQVVDARGEHHVALTSDATATNTLAYLFPTWSPDSHHVAFVRVDSSDAVHEAALYVALPSGGNPVTVFKSTLQIPFYLYWSPDSQWIGFLAQTENEMALMLGRADGKSQARQLQAGAPLYWGWSPDSRSLLMHVGGNARNSGTAQLAVLPREGSGLPKKLMQGPAEFQAPQYSPDGSQMLFAGTGTGSSDALFLADAQGDHARPIAEYAGTIAFAWSPDGKKIASLVTPADADLPFEGPIWVSEADGSNRRKLSDENALAFYWSPDNQQIAFLTVTLSRQGQGCHCPAAGLGAPLPQAQVIRLNWRVANVGDPRPRTLVTFTPTGDFLAVLPYFDQYARSLTFWSPDSQHFVYTQSEGEAAGSVWVADVAGSHPPLRVGDGTIAVWSWK
ncbi:MAG: PD40 domain-containing protein [Chloroflexota bacterium]|nr:PD40 domain-containing protein [Chloroflexota bacterium]